MVSLITKICRFEAFLEVSVPLPAGLSWDQAIYERTNIARRIRERNGRTYIPRPQTFVIIKTDSGQPSGLIVYSSDLPADENISIYDGLSPCGESTIDFLLDNYDVESRIKALRGDLHAVPVGKKSYLPTRGHQQPIVEFMASNIEELESWLCFIFEPGKIIPLGIQPHVERPHGTYKIKRPRNMRYPNRPQDPDFGK
jgi:hypothetical protein